MTLRVHVLLLCLVGCATERLVVPEADWQTVPAPQRTKLDQQHAASLAAARAELAAATIALGEAQRVKVATPPPPARAAATGDAWGAAVRDHEQARGAAFTRVGTAAADWRRANLAWSQVRLDTARARLEMVVCEREIDRARAIDRSLVVGESYDTAPVRGQFSQAQVRWYKLNEQARAAHLAVERCAASLASAKEAYAQVMRGGPDPIGQPAVAADARPARLELAAWAVKSDDVRRAYGRRRVLDILTASPRLRRPKLQLAARLVVLPAPAPDKPAEPARPVEPPKQAIAAPIARPAPLTRPVEPPRAPLAAPVAKPAPVARPVEPPKTATAAPVARPVEPPKTATAATVAKPRPGEPPKTATAAPVAKPVEPQARPREAEPLFPSPASAKPVEPRP